MNYDDEEMDMALIHVWLMFDSVDLEKTISRLEDEKVDDNSIDGFECACSEWIETHINNLIKEYKEFVDHEVDDLRKKVINNEKVQ